MLDDYTPYRLVNANNPIFKREYRALHIHAHSVEMRQYSLLWATVLGVLQIISLVALGRYLREVILVYLLLYFGISFAIDLYMIVITVNVWYDRTRSEDWDVMRLARNTDAELVQIYQALAQLRVWRAMVANATLHMSFVIVVAPILLFLLPGIALSLVGMFGTSTTFTNWFPFIALYIGAWGFVGLFIYEPIWHWQTVTAVAIALAARLRDSGSTLSIGALVAFIFRLLLFLAILALTLMVIGRSWWALLTSAAVIVGTFGAGGLMRSLHRTICGWATSATVHAMGR
jgi:hypothetical protein